MSYSNCYSADSGHGTSTCDTAAITQKIVVVQQVANPRPRKRVPFMVPWCQIQVPYPPGSLVIHNNNYWYNTEKLEFSPPGYGCWKIFDMQKFLCHLDGEMTGRSIGIDVPLYVEPVATCTPVTVPGMVVAGANESNGGGCPLKMWDIGSVVADADGKLYYNTVKTATYPPSADWQGGYTLEQMLVKLLKLMP